MLKNMIFRSIKDSDAPGIHAMAFESWQHTYSNIFDQQFIQTFVDKNYSADAIVALFPKIQAGSMFFYVVEYESKIIGLCNIGINKEGAELYRIYLLPTYIGQGIGKRLLELGEAFVLENKTNTISCFVHKNNKIGIRFYLNSSFKHIPEKDKDDKWYMEKGLPK